MLVTAFIYRPKLDEATGEEHTELFMVTCVDIGGWVPSFVVNQACCSAPRKSLAEHEAGTLAHLKSQQ